MKIVNKHNRSNGVRFGLCLAACMIWSRVAGAEVDLADKDGWTFTFDGRVNAFLSGGYGDAFPNPTADPGGSSHAVMGSGRATDGRADVGWLPNYGQQDADNKYKAIRVRSGMYGNILGFGVSRKVGENTKIRGYVSIWSTVESLGYDKWYPVIAEAREGYFDVEGKWGMLTVGRTLGYLGRTAYEIDSAYGHGFGVGLPCTDELGPACGHIGTGYVFPGYGANISYTTPSLGGLRLHVGLFDPAVLGTDPTEWSHAGFVRPEGSLTFESPLGEMGKIKIGVEGLYQPISRCMETLCMMGKVNGSLWGVSGGARLEIGPLRLGVSGFTGKGLGLFYALQRSSAAEDQSMDKNIRTFSGFYGQGGLVFGRFQLAGGFGLSLVNQTTFDKSDATISVIHYQRGVSAAVYYYASDSIVIGLDWFMFAAGWYGAPLLDPNDPTIVTGKLKGETQVLNFVNAGVTYHW